jgi:hypothetical protein
LLQLLLLPVRAPARESSTPESRPTPLNLSPDWSGHHWQDRLIILFADRPDRSGTTEQFRLFQTHRAGLTERDVVIYGVFESGEIWQVRGEEITTAPLVRSQLRQLHRRYGAEPGTSLVILVGKDGGVKSRYDMPADPHSIFREIDAMPMRQRESGRKW